MVSLKFKEALEAYRSEDPRLCTALKILYDTNKYFRFWVESITIKNVVDKLLEEGKLSEKLKDLIDFALNKGLGDVLLSEAYFLLQKYFYVNFCVRALLESEILAEIDKAIIQKLGPQDENSLRRIRFKVMQYLAQKGSKTLASKKIGKQATTINNGDEQDDLEQIATMYLDLYNIIVDTQNVGYEKIFVPLRTVMEKLLPKWMEKHKTTQRGRLLGQWYYLKNKRVSLAPRWVLYKSTLINLNNGNLIELTPVASEILLSFLKGEVKEPLTISYYILRNLSREGIISDEEGAYLAVPHRRRIILELTLKCNLNCRYCFNRFMNREFELEPRDYEEIIKSLPPNTEITLFGGEPFIYPHILDVLKLIEKYDKNFVVRCFTNGTLTERVVNVLKEVKKPIYLLVSVDGNKEAHEKIRGKGTYDKVKDTLQRVKREAPWHKIVIKTTVSKINIDSLEDMLEDLKGLYDYVAFGELHITGNAAGKAGEKVDYSEWFEILTRLREKYPLWDPAEDELFNRCGFGVGLIYIRSDGYIGGCTEEDIAKHHIFEFFDYGGSLWDLIPIKLPNKECIHCPLWWACMGGCRARAYRLTGSWSGCDTERKKYVEKSLEFILSNSALSKR